MRKLTIFFALLIAITFMLVMAACNNGKSLGSILDDFFSSHSDHVPPTQTPEPTSTHLFSPYEYDFQSTLTAFYDIQTETPIDLILNDFYTYHNNRGMEAVEGLLQIDPENALALAIRGAFKLRQEEWDVGFEDSNKALVIDPNLAFAYVNRAWYYQYHLKNLETARNEIDIALELEPDLAYAHCIKAGLHNTTNDSQQMIQSYEKAIELRPDYYIAYINLGPITYPSDDDIHGIISYFDKAIEINPDADQAYYFRELIHNNFLGPDPESEITNLSEIINMGMQTPYLYGHRSDAYIRVGDFANAISDLEHIIEIDPDKIDAYNTIAILLAYTNGDLEKALAYNNKALELLPEGKRSLDTRGYIYYKMGKYDEAFQIFSDLIEYGYEGSYYGRGLIYYSRGDKENMISDFKTYLASLSVDFRITKVNNILKEIGVD